MKQQLNVVNLTINTIRLPSGATIHPSGVVARSNPAYKPVGELLGVPVLVSHCESISNLPPPEKGTIYIVPTVVRVQVPERNDLVSPCKLIRDGNQIVGCSSFEANSKLCT